jgi:thioredoxin 1
MVFRIFFLSFLFSAVYFSVTAQNTSTVVNKKAAIDPAKSTISSKESKQEVHKALNQTISPAQNTSKPTGATTHKEPKQMFQPTSNIQKTAASTSNGHIASEKKDIKPAAPSVVKPQIKETLNTKNTKVDTVITKSNSNQLQQFNLDFASDATEADFYDSKTLGQVQKEIKSGKKKYILYFGAPWCIPCRMMRETVFKAHDVKKYLNTYTISYVNIDDFNGMDIKDKYKVKNVPYMIVFDERGKVIDRIDGSVSSTKFSEQLKDYQVRK